MCEAKPGRRCAADACEDRERTSAQYDAAHPDGPVVNAIMNAESQFGFRPTSGMDQMITDELHNYGDMVREAARSGETVPAPTLGSLRDSMDQMPDDNIEDISEGDASKIRAELEALIERHGDDRELEALPASLDGEADGEAEPVPYLANLGALIEKQNTLHATRLADLGVEDWCSRVITAAELGDDTLDTVEFAEDGVPGEWYVRGTVRVDLTAVVPEGEDPDAWIGDNLDRVSALANAYGGQLGDTYDAGGREIGFDFLSVATPNDTVNSATLPVRDQAIRLRLALTPGSDGPSFAETAKSIFTTDPGSA